jgi:hypothetical protein
MKGHQGALSVHPDGPIEYQYELGKFRTSCGWDLRADDLEQQAPNHRLLRKPASMTLTPDQQKRFDSFWIKVENKEFADNQLQAFIASELQIERERLSAALRESANVFFGSMT